MFLSLRHSVLTGFIIVLYLLFTLILSAPQGVQIGNSDHEPLQYLKQDYVLSNNYAPLSCLNVL